MESIKFDESGRWMAVALGHSINVFDIKTKVRFCLVPETPETEEKKEARPAKKRKKNRVLDIKQLDVVLPIVRFFVFSDSSHIISGGDDKVLRVWNLETQVQENSCVLSKRIEKGLMTSNGTLLVADKPGDVFEYTVPELDGGTCVMGHFGLISGMMQDGKDGAILSCDVDGKVRVSGYPLLCDIKQFCLGHTTSVACMTHTQGIGPHNMSLLVTGGGESEMRVWDQHKGDCLLLERVQVEGLTTDERAHAPNRSNSEVEKIVRAQYEKANKGNKTSDGGDDDVPGIVIGFESYISLLTYCPSTKTIAAVVNPYCGVLFYQFDVSDAGVSISKRWQMPTAQRPDAITFDEAGLLLILQASKETPLLVIDPHARTQSNGYGWVKLSEDHSSAVDNCEDYERRRFSRAHRLAEYKKKGDRNQAKVAAHNAALLKEKAQAEKAESTAE